MLQLQPQLIQLKPNFEVIMFTCTDNLNLKSLLLVLHCKASASNHLLLLFYKMVEQLQRTLGHRSQAFPI
jgi:hypothetical protein